MRKRTGMTSSASGWELRQEDLQSRLAHLQRETGPSHQDIQRRIFKIQTLLQVLGILCNQRTTSKFSIRHLPGFLFGTSIRWLKSRECFNRILLGQTREIM